MVWFDAVSRQRVVVSGARRHVSLSPVNSRDWTREAMMSFSSISIPSFSPYAAAYAVSEAGCLSRQGWFTISSIVCTVFWWTLIF